MYSVQKKLYCNKVLLYCSCNNYAFIYVNCAGKVSITGWEISGKNRLQSHTRQVFSYLGLICSIFCGGKMHRYHLELYLRVRLLYMWIASVHEHIQSQMMINSERSWTGLFLKSIECSACWDQVLGWDFKRTSTCTIHVVCCAVSNRNIFVPSFAVCWWMSFAFLSVYI